MKKLSQFAQPLFYLIFVLVPSIWWLVAVSSESLWAPDFYSQASFWGRLAGIIGIGLFAGNLLLSSRTFFLDHLFNGLDKVYLLHKTTGKLTWYFLILHGFLVGFRWIEQSPATVINIWFTLPAPSLELLLGRIALLLLTIIVVITIYIRMRYETKRLLHLWLGLAVFLGIVHAVLISSTLAENTGLRYYLVIICLVSLFSYIRKTILGTWLTPHTTARVANITQLTPTITQLDLVTENANLFPKHWLAGQFAFVRVNQPKWRYDNHPFSIISRPNDHQISFAIKGVGDFSKSISQLETDTKITLEGPFGGFNYQTYPNPHQVWIAGGIGITPILAMAREFPLDPRVADYQIHLIYSVSKPEDAVFVTELTTISNTYPNFRFTLWDSSTQGSWDITHLDPTEITSADFLLCGPPSMITSITRQLRSRRVANSRIHYELFKMF